jgi:hypothetical protein
MQLLTYILIIFLTGAFERKYLGLKRSCQNSFFKKMLEKFVD